MEDSGRTIRTPRKLELIPQKDGPLKRKEKKENVFYKKAKEFFSAKDEEKKGLAFKEMVDEGSFNQLKIVYEDMSARKKFFKDKNQNGFLARLPFVLLSKMEKSPDEAFHMFKSFSYYEDSKENKEDILKETFGLMKKSNKPYIWLDFFGHIGKESEYFSLAKGALLDYFSRKISKISKIKSEEERMVKEEELAKEMFDTVGHKTIGSESFNDEEKERFNNQYNWLRRKKVDGSYKERVA